MKECKLSNAKGLQQRSLLFSPTFNIACSARNIFLAAIFLNCKINVLAVQAHM